MADNELIMILRDEGGESPGAPPRPFDDYQRPFVTKPPPAPEPIPVTIAKPSSEYTASVENKLLQNAVNWDRDRIKEQKTKSDIGEPTMPTQATSAGSFPIPLPVTIVGGMPSYAKEVAGASAPRASSSSGGDIFDIAKQARAETGMLGILRDEADTTEYMNELLTEQEKRRRGIAGIIETANQAQSESAALGQLRMEADMLEKINNLYKAKPVDMSFDAQVQRRIEENEKKLEEQANQQRVNEAAIKARPTYGPEPTPDIRFDQSVDKRIEEMEKKRADQEREKRLNEAAIKARPDLGPDPKQQQGKDLQQTGMIASLAGFGNIGAALGTTGRAIQDQSTVNKTAAGMAGVNAVNVTGQSAITGAAGFASGVARNNPLPAVIEGAEVAGKALQGLGVAGMSGAIALGPLGPAALAAGTGVVAMGAAVTAVTGVMNDFVRRGEELAYLSGELSAAIARRDVATLNLDIEEANRLGPQLAQLIDTQTAFNTELRSALLPLKQILIQQLNGIGNQLTNITRTNQPIVGLISGFAQVQSFALSQAMQVITTPLTLIADRLNALLGGQQRVERKDKSGEFVIEQIYDLARQTFPGPGPVDPAIVKRRNKAADNPLFDRFKDKTFSGSGGDF